MPAITFGTEGWRALLADDYTFANVRLVARAAGAWFKEQRQTGPRRSGPRDAVRDFRGVGWRDVERQRSELAGQAEGTVRCCSSERAEVKVVRGHPDPTFDWQRPEPIDKYLEPSVPLTADPLVNVGLATGGDADRFRMMAEGECFDRIDLDILREQRKRLTRRIPKLTERRLAGQKVAQINHLDGAKFICEDGSWLLARLSGTEALVRVYAEAWSEADLRALLEDGRQFILKAAER
jgi:phosphomannomutase